MTIDTAALGVDPICRRSFADLAEARGMTEATLLRLLVEAFVATNIVGTSARDRTPEQRLADSIARRITRDGATTRGQVWRSMSSRDRDHGRGLLDQALTLGHDQRLFRVNGNDITPRPALAQ